MNSSQKSFYIVLAKVVFKLWHVVIITLRITLNVKNKKAMRERERETMVEEGMEGRRKEGRKNEV